MAENDIDYFIEKVGPQRNPISTTRGPETAGSHRSATRTTSRNYSGASTPGP